MTEVSNVLDCPFCGVVGAPYIDDSVGYRVVCGSCGSSGPDNEHEPLTAKVILTR